MDRGITVAAVATALYVSVFASENPDQLIKAGHWKRAKPLVEAAYAKNPKDVHTLLLMAKIKRVWGDLDGARKLTEEAVTLDANNFDAHFQLADILGDQISKANLFQKMSLAGKLRGEMETSLRLNPNNAEAHFAMMQYYLQAPGIAGGGKDKARAELAAIAKLSPAQGFLAESEFARHEKQPMNLGELYRKAREADPENYEVATPYCNYLFNEKRWDLGEKCSSDLVKLDRGRQSGYSGLAIVYASEQRWKELDATLADAERNVPDSRLPYFTAGRVLADSGTDNTRAERYLRYFLAQEPEPNVRLSRAHWWLGHLFEKQKRKPEAIAEYETTI